LIDFRTLIPKVKLYALNVYILLRKLHQFEMLSIERVPGSNRHIVLISVTRSTFLLALRVTNPCLGGSRFCASFSHFTTCEASEKSKMISGLKTKVSEVKVELIKMIKLIVLLGKISKEDIRESSLLVLRLR
jgi:hypothetical protein